MFDHRVDRAQAERDLEAKDVDCLERIRELLDAEFKVLFRDTDDSKNDLRKAEAFVLEHTGIEADISDTLLMFADGDYGFIYDSEQIFGFICDLMNNEMSRDSANEMAGIFSEYYIQFGDDIFKNLESNHE